MLQNWYRLETVVVPFLLLMISLTTALKESDESALRKTDLDRRRHMVFLIDRTLATLTQNIPHYYHPHWHIYGVPGFVRHETHLPEAMSLSQGHQGYFNHLVRTTTVIGALLHLQTRSWIVVMYRILVIHSYVFSSRAPLEQILLV